MGRKLKVNTVVPGEPGSGQGFAVFGPDDDVPEWAAKQIGDHAWADGADAGDGPPAKSANKAEWVAYAVAQGADEADAEASTKDDLIATYGD